MHFPEHSPRFEKVLREMRGRRLAVIGHARPDGDCIGSQVAMAAILVQAGAAEVVCVNGDPVPRRLQFLLGDRPFLRTEDILAKAGEYEAVFVDCADKGRVGDRLKAAFPEVLLEVDHHMSNGGYACHDFVDTAASATCELLAGMCADLGLKMDRVMAQALYTGILTDTGQFRFNSTTRKTFALASELLAHGVVPAEVGFHVYERESIGRMKLLQRFLSSLQMECGGRVCIGRLPAGVFEETGTTAEDTEGMVDYARMIDGVDVGVLIEERADGSVKASLRAKEPVYRLDQVAALFNGGGHACAAGLNLKKDTANFRERLVEAIRVRLTEVTAAKA